MLSDKKKVVEHYQECSSRDEMSKIQQNSLKFLNIFCLPASDFHDVSSDHVTRISLDWFTVFSSRFWNQSRNQSTSSTKI